MMLQPPPLHESALHWQFPLGFTAVLTDRHRLILKTMLRINGLTGIDLINIQSICRIIE